MRTCLTESTKKGADELTETKAAIMGNAEVCTMSSTYMLWLLAWCSSVGLLAVGTGVSLALLPDLRTPFLLLGKLFQS